jgi:hypothetical protein
MRDGFRVWGAPTAEDALALSILATLLSASPASSSKIAPLCASPYPAGDSNITIFLQHLPKEPQRQVTLRQQQPIVARELEESSAGLHQSLLQASQRQGGDLGSQRQPPPRTYK